MTRDEILGMEAGRELDALMAEKVMGYEHLPFPAVPAFQRPTEGGVEMLFELPHYSADIAAAWEIVEEVHRLGLNVSVWKGRLWCCGFYTKSETPQEMGHSYSDTAPLAICRAALLAVMEVDDAS